MRIKSVTLYSLPYVVAVASFLVAAHQVAPAPNGIDLWHTNTKAEIFSGQTVNRSLKATDCQCMKQRLIGRQKGVR
jgi:hypothetical protein